MVVLQAISWEGVDIGGEDGGGTGEYTVTIYGRCKNGQSASVSTLFSPYFFIKKPPDVTPKALEFKIIELNEYHQKRDNCKYPIKVSFVKRKDLWGFSNNEMREFACLEFKSLERMRRFAATCKYKSDWTSHPKGIKVYENSIEPLLRFMHLSGIQSTGWFETTGSKAYNTTCDIDLFCDDWRTMKPIVDDSIAPLKIMSLDIESYSSTGKFPSADVPGDVAFQVGFTTKVYGKDDIEQVCFCVKQTNNVNAVYFETEKDMFQAVWEYIVKTDPDIITGWNIFGFDLEYMYKRTLMFNDPRTLCIGRRQCKPSTLVEKVLSSSALGQNVLKMLPMPGRYVFDLFQLIKAEHKLESYSLNNVSKEFLGDQKMDMPIKELFAHFSNGDADKLGEVAEYCMKDTELPVKLMEKLYTIENLVEMAKATWVPINYLSERGQQIKVFSQIAKKARELKFIIPTIDKNQTVVDFEGATVLEAQTGAYYTPITALDFEGLYPSIMIAHNLCYSTIVDNPKYDNLPGVTYEDHGKYRFAQNVESLLPAILIDLKQFRKKAKKDMAAAKGTPMYHVYNGKQLAYKISMNSVYGFTGASKGMLPLVAIASTVTGQGRFMIQQSKEYVEEHFPGSKVRYGDSVLGNTPVLTQDGPVKISDLGGSWYPYPGFMKDGVGKEQHDLNIQVWTHEGWKMARRVIRHKCEKKIYRVLTHTGLVDVTEDHSLLDLDVREIKPADVTVGQELFHSFPDVEIFGNGSCTNEQAYIYGMFVGDGSCGSYEHKYSWAINNADVNLLTRCRYILEKIHGKPFKILDTIESSGVYKLVPSHGDLKTFTINYHAQCYDGKCKKVPTCVLVHEETCRSFLEGLWDSDGCRRDNEAGGCHRIDTKNQVTAQWYFLLLRKLGYSVSLNCRDDNYRLTWTNMKQRKNPNAIKKVFILHEQYDDYVYDIETDAGTFQAGVGQMIVKNTDSIMVEFDTCGKTGVDAISHSWDLGEQAAKQITNLFKPPNNLELEKIYCPYFLYSKKRYAAKMWVKDGDAMEMTKIDIKGLQVVRRDSCPFVREVCQRVIEMNMDSEDPRSYVKEMTDALLAGNVPMDKLILSKRLGESYKSNNLAHVAVRDKMKTRAPGSEPLSGDRVQFVIVCGLKKDKMYQKAEDPKWVIEQNIPLDYQYYFKHQFETPVHALII